MANTTDTPDGDTSSPSGDYQQLLDPLLELTQKLNASVDLCVHLERLSIDDSFDSAKCVVLTNTGWECTVPMSVLLGHRDDPATEVVMARARDSALLKLEDNILALASIASATADMILARRNSESADQLAGAFGVERSQL